MRRIALALVLVLLLAGAAWAQMTPQSLVASYDSLADAILALKQAEADLVWSMLDHHYHAAEAAMERQDFATAAAEMALFGNEGDNAVAGVRKRLVDGGHHHHAGAGADEMYETGYVVVTRAAKEEILAASAAMRQASTVGAREDAWARFQAAGRSLMEAR